LAQVGEICQRHNVLIISDEIHGDITYPPHRYTPLASISDKLAQISFTCLSPAKTFNIAGMVDAMTVIPNEAHRAQFHYFAHRYQINKTNVFASAAIEAAYSHGEPWLEALLAYLQKNVAFIRSYLQVNINRVSLVEPEGTYLIWLNFAGLELDAKLLAKFLAQNAGIAVNPGYWFGREGAGFARMNIACPQPILQEAMSRLAQAIETQEG
jgi:cystathionine beta-lyase